MGMFLAGILVAISFTVFFGWECADDAGDWIILSFLGIVFGAFSLIFVGIPSFFAETTPANPNKIDIYAIKDNRETHGKFSLGYGSVEEELYYYFITEDSEGFKSINKSKVSSSRLKEEITEQPYVLIYEKRFKSAFARFMYGEYSGGKLYEFHVPKNTITTEYKIDLE